MVRALATLLLSIATMAAAAEQPPASPAPSPAPSPSPSPTPSGLVLKDASGDWSARLTGRVQGDYRYFSPSDTLPDTFDLRRARVGLEFTFLKDYFFYVEGEFATGNPQGNTPQSASLTNAYLDFNWVPWARPRVGQFKPPIGLENSAPDVLTDFQERSLTQNLLQNLNYDRGVMVHGVPHEGLYYGVSLTNGTGLNLDERNGSPQDASASGKDWTGRVAVNLAPFVHWSHGVAHLALGYKDGTVSNAPTQGSGGTAGFVAATGRTEALGATFFTPQAFNGAGGVTDAEDVDRTIEVAELAVVWKAVKLQSEMWRASYDGQVIAPNPLAFSREIEAYYVSLCWMLTGETYASSYGNTATFGRMKAKRNFHGREGAGAGAWEIGARYSQFDASDFNDGNPAGSGMLGATAPTSVSTNEAQGATLMVKWIVNPYVRVLLNGIRTEFETPITTNGVTYDEEKAVTFRAQFDF